MEGNGLGLAISRKIVEALGGSISVSSVVGEGTAIYMHVPVTVPAKKERRRLVEDERTHDRPAVSLVLSRQLSKDGIQEMLESLGCLTTTHTASDKLLSQLTQSAPALIVLDLDAAEKNGFQLLSAVREAFPNGTCSIVVVADGARPDMGSRCKEAGADAFVPKPIDVNSLLVNAQKLLGLSYVPEASEADVHTAPDPTRSPNRFELPRDLRRAMGEAVQDGDMALLREAVPILRELTDTMPRAEDLIEMIEHFEIDRIAQIVTGKPNGI
jgi:CheY-like chemotaxis protein